MDDKAGFTYIKALSPCITALLICHVWGPYKILPSISWAPFTLKVIESADVIKLEIFSPLADVVLIFMYSTCPDPVVGVPLNSFSDHNQALPSAGCCEPD